MHNRTSRLGLAVLLLAVALSLANSQADADVHSGIGGTRENPSSPADTVFKGYAGHLGQFA